MVHLGKTKVLSLACSIMMAFGVFTIASSALATTPPPIQSNSSLERSIDSKIAKIERDYAIKVEYKNVKSVSRLRFTRSVTLDDVDIMLDSIQETLSCYPKQIGKALHINKINLCGELYSGDTPIDGMSYATFIKDRLSCTDIFLCVPSYNGAQATLHHELLHAIEYTYPVDEKKWNKLLSEGNSYLSGNEDETYAYASGELVDQPGFVSLYAYSEPMEDRAEIYANILNYTQDDISRARHANDAVLAAKAEFLMNYLVETFDNIPGSSDYINTLQSCYDELFGRRYFSARSIYVASDTFEASLGPTNKYKKVKINKGEVVYQLTSLQNPKQSILILDGDANVLYVEEKKVKLIESVQPQPLLEDLLNYDVEVAYDTELQGIRYECILNGTKVSTRNAMLLYGRLNAILKTMKKNGNVCGIKKIVAVDNLRVNGNPTSTYVSDNMLIIDIHYATNGSILTALTPCEKLNEAA